MDYGMDLITTESTSFANKQFSLEGCGDFDFIRHFANADVTYKQSSIRSASIQADASVINDYGVEVKNNTLFIAGKSDKKLTTPPKILITGPSFKKLEVEGVGYFHCKEVLLGDVFVHLKGSGSIYMDGTAMSAIIRLSGNGLINAKGLLCENVKTHIAGNGAIMSNANTSSASIICGAGEIQIYGSPSKETSKVDGQGVVTTKSNNDLTSTFTPESTNSLPGLNRPLHPAESVSALPSPNSDNKDQSLSVENMLKIIEVAGGRDEFKKAPHSSIANILISILLLSCFPFFMWVGNSSEGFSSDQQLSLFRLLPVSVLGSVFTMFLVKVLYLSSVKGHFIVSSKDSLSLILLGALTYGLDTALSIKYDLILNTVNKWVGFIYESALPGQLASALFLTTILFVVYLLVREHILKPALRDN